MQKAIILFAHGSRDPLWHQPIEAVARNIALQSQTTLVRCAYLELSSPDLPSTVASLVAVGVHSFTIVPLFLGVGRHAREDLPVLVQQMQVQYPELHFKLQPAVGEDTRLIALLATIALEHH